VFLNVRLEAENSGSDIVDISAPAEQQCNKPKNKHNKSAHMHAALHSKEAEGSRERGVSLGSDSVDDEMLKFHAKCLLSRRQ
jgi:hypothetical protein